MELDLSCFDKDFDRLNLLVQEQSKHLRKKEKLYESQVYTFLEENREDLLDYALLEQVRRDQWNRQYGFLLSQLGYESVPIKNQQDMLNESFWGDLDSLLSRIKGDGRKLLIKNSIKNGEPIPEYLFESDLTDDLKDVLMSLNPKYSGGEFLPDFKNKEVEIARIVFIKTVLNDVVSIRSEIDQETYKFTCIGEYDEEEFVINPSKSKKIPSTKDLINMILNLKINVEGELISYLFWNFKFWYFESEDTNPEYDFVVESDYYQKTGRRNHQISLSLLELLFHHPLPRNMHI